MGQGPEKKAPQRKKPLRVPGPSRAEILPCHAGNLSPCPCPRSPINGLAETWPSGRRHAPAKGADPKGSRGFESLRLRHPPHDICALSVRRGNFPLFPGVSTVSRCRRRHHLPSSPAFPPRVSAPGRTGSVCPECKNGEVSGSMEVFGPFARLLSLNHCLMSVDYGRIPCSLGTGNRKRRIRDQISPDRDSNPRRGDRAKQRIRATGLRGRSIILPGHSEIEPDHQRSTAPERLVAGAPVPGLVGGRCMSTHATRQPGWIHEIIPSRDLCNGTVQRRTEVGASFRALRAD